MGLWRRFWRVPKASPRSRGKKKPPEGRLTGVERGDKSKKDRPWLGGLKTIEGGAGPSRSTGGHQIDGIGSHRPRRHFDGAGETTKTHAGNEK